MIYLRRCISAFIEATRTFLTPAVPRDAAAISWFTLFSLVPAALVLLSLVDAFLGWMNLHEQVLRQIATLFPGPRGIVTTQMGLMTNPSPPVVVSCLLIVLWSSTWVCMFIENAMNRAWGVTRQRTFWESRILSIALLGMGGILLLSSALVTTLVSALRSRARQHIPELAGEEIINWLWSSILLGAGFAAGLIVFYVVYKWMPDRKVTWTDALSGAFMATILWEVASYMFAKLVPAFGYQQIYGKMGTMVVVLVWIYTSSLILLYGANFSAKLHDSDEDAVGEKGKQRLAVVPARDPSERVSIFPRHR